MSKYLTASQTSYNYLYNISILRHLVFQKETV